MGGRGGGDQGTRREGEEPGADHRLLDPTPPRAAPRGLRFCTPTTRNGRESSTKGHVYVQSPPLGVRSEPRNRQAPDGTLPTRMFRSMGAPARTVNAGKSGCSRPSLQSLRVNRDGQLIGSYENTSSREESVTTTRTPRDDSDHQRAGKVPKKIWPPTISVLTGDPWAGTRGTRRSSAVRRGGVTPRRGPRTATKGTRSPPGVRGPGEPGCPPPGWCRCGCAAVTAMRPGNWGRRRDPRS